MTELEEEEGIRGIITLSKQRGYNNLLFFRRNFPTLSVRRERKKAGS